ncbi:MAG: hypothetical protein KKD17_00015 [Nanoarchaeota archaeon]|nr:hypothetical protein [Nanoarchaeota archaeon]
MRTGEIHIGRASRNDLMAYSLLQRTFGRDEAAAVLKRISSNYGEQSCEAMVTDHMGDGFYATVQLQRPLSGKDASGDVHVSELCVCVNPRSGKTIAGVTVRADPRNLDRDAAAYVRQCCEELLSELRGESE